MKPNPMIPTRVMPSLSDIATVAARGGIGYPSRMEPPFGQPYRLERGRAVMVPIIAILPAGFDDMRAEAGAEGYRFLERLALERQSGDCRFDGEGETLLAAYVGDTLAGLEGVTRDPVLAGHSRMRRFYVRAPFRRAGIGRELAVALLATTQFPALVNAANADAPAFWESLGFTPDPRHGHTHILARHDVML